MGRCSSLNLHLVSRMASAASKSHQTFFPLPASGTNTYLWMRFYKREVKPLCPPPSPMLKMTTVRQSGFTAVHILTAHGVTKCLGLEVRGQVKFISNECFLLEGLLLPWPHVHWIKNLIKRHYTGHSLLVSDLS